MPKFDRPTRAAFSCALAVVLVAPAAAQRETRERHIFVTVTGRDDAPARDLKVMRPSMRESRKMRVA